MEELPVERKLKSSIVPQIVLAEKLSEQKFYRIHKFYMYINDVVAFLLGAGVVSIDIFGFIAQPQTTINASQSRLTTEYLLLLVLIIIWALLKTYIKQEDTQKKFELAKACQVKFREFEGRLEGILTKSNPIKQLEELRENIAMARDAAEDAWIYTSLTPEKYQAEIKKRLDHLCQTYKAYWTDVREDIERIEV